ncbi:MAG: hypothetical protein AAF892_00985 [Cyanobacteria bacterium P01_D01_bin.71]
MNAFTPGIIIALLIMFLLGILAGYSLVQGRTRKQIQELKVAQRRLAEMEQSHELRLREATAKLRQDYEKELAATIEHYQDQLSQKTVEMEQIYQTRLRVLQQGAAPVPSPVAPRREAIGAAPVPPSTAVSPKEAIDAVPDRSSQPETLLQPAETAIANEPLTDFPQPDPTRFERELKQEYETRLQTATQELQASYEQQLAEATQAARADIAAEYEQQLAVKQQEFEQTVTERQAELEQAVADLRAELETAQSLMLSNPEVSTPSQIMGIDDDETTVTLSAPQSPGVMMPTTDGTLPEAQLGEHVQAVTQQAKAAFEERLADQLATQQTQFERQLAERLEGQQIEFDRRFRELETDYRRKVAELKNAAPESVLSPVDDLFSDDDFEELTPSQPEIPIEDDLFADELFADISKPEAPSEPQQQSTAIKDDLFAEELFGDAAKAAPTSDSGDAVDQDNSDDDDDDNLGPLDLSDIV